MLIDRNPNLILYNGNCYTLSRPAVVRAIAIADDRIMAMGSNKEIRKLASPKTRILDLRGLTVLPGFTDCHLHLYSYGTSLSRLNFRLYPTLQSALEEIGKRSANLEDDEWLLGRGWDKNYWGMREFPTRYDLDHVCSNPAAFFSHDGHSLWLNSKALKLLGIENRDDLQSNEMYRTDEKGELTGILHEGAAYSADKMIPEPTFENKLKSIMLAQKRAFKMGVTGVHDFDEDKDKYRLLQHASMTGKLRLKLLCAIRYEDFEDKEQFPVVSGFGSPNLRFGPLKLYADGALGSQTADMFQPYEGSSNYGLGTLSADELTRIITDAESKGLSCAIHAIGDKANFNVMKAFESNSPPYTPLLPRRIEHVQLIRKQDIPLLKRTGAIASVQPSHLLADRDTADEYWGRRCRYAYAFRTMIKSRIRLCFGSDAPIEEINPLEAIDAAVNRCEPNDPRGAWYPDERITVRQAVEALTRNASILGGNSHQTGKITPGHLADVVILTDDIFKVRKRDIHTIKVASTISSGKVVYNKEKL
ncbi:MAG: amidohydrolase family protein [candidate division Zixibacteria bacterium]|nr:amidohydrolase family protein [candidate division Zixibacteria bacterium]